MEVKVSKEVYLLCRELERLEDDLDFTVFYSFAEILESHHYCPAFIFGMVYYEVQYDEDNYLRVLDFGVKSWKEKGDVLTEKEIEELTKQIQEDYEKVQ